MKNMRNLYDVLIEGIPEDAPVDDAMSAHSGAIVYSNGNIGLSEFRYGFDTRQALDRGNITGKSLRELAEGVKSWNLTEAAFGVAAMNAYYNAPETAEKNGVKLAGSLRSKDRNADPFIAHQKDAAGKKVVVLGQFPYMEKLLGPVSDLYVVSRYPRKGYYPETAAEYLIPGSDFVFIGVSYFLEKSLPHLLELAKDSYVGLVGPVTVLSPVLFDYGVDELDGFVPKDAGLAERIYKEQERGKIYASGEKVSLRKVDYEAFRKS